MYQLYAVPRGGPQASGARPFPPSATEYWNSHLSGVAFFSPPSPAPVFPLWPRPGAAHLLQRLREVGVPHAIATSGRHPEIDASLEALSVPQTTVVVDRGDVARAKPEPDLFVMAAKRLSVPAEECYVVGDAVWDLLAARRGRMFSVGLLTGGYGADELLAAGAYRVYRDAAELDASLDELGVLP